LLFQTYVQAYLKIQNHLPTWVVSTTPRPLHHRFEQPPGIWQTLRISQQNGCAQYLWRENVLPVPGIKFRSSRLSRRLLTYLLIYLLHGAQSFLSS
jgi:hypothetical protein